MAENISPKILIVDDEHGLRTGTKRLLESEGCTVETAANGSEGIKLGTAEEFDIAIIDLRMPDIDGIHVLEEILKVHPNTVCLMATAYASYDTAIEATKIGAYSYIPKPFSPEELISLVTKGYHKRELLLEAEKWKREREERLLEVAFEKTRLNTIINSITDGLLAVNRSGEAVLFNPAALKYLQLDKIDIEEKIIGRLHPGIASLINKILNDEKFAGKSYSSQIEINNSQKFFIEVTSSPIAHPDGTLAGVVAVIKDITELKKIEYLKSQFVSMVSHELKAPIAAVYGYLKLFSEGTIPLTEEQKLNYINRSQVRLDGLLKMVNDLLDISRMEMKRVNREIKNLQLGEIIKSVIELFQLEAESRNISIRYSEKEKLPLIKADAGEMNRLFTNLISNAVKYNKEGGEINIAADFNEHYIIVSVKDNGIGMKPEEKEKLFREFFRAKNEFTKNISGTGLGLSLVKRLVDSYAGKIKVESEYGKGTTFKIYLPYLRR